MEKEIRGVQYKVSLHAKCKHQWHQWKRLHVWIKMMTIRYLYQCLKACDTVLWAMQHQHRWHVWNVSVSKTNTTL